MKYAPYDLTFKELLTITYCFSFLFFDFFGVFEFFLIFIFSLLSRGAFINPYDLGLRQVNIGRAGILFDMLDAGRFGGREDRRPPRQKRKRDLARGRIMRLRDIRNTSTFRLTILRAAFPVLSLLMFPMAMFVAFRYGPIGAAIVSVLLMALALLDIYTNFPGPRPKTYEAIQWVQTFVAVVFVVLLLGGPASMN